MKNKTIARVLKETRKQNNLSVKDVALLLKKKSVSVAEKTIYGWENGQTQPNADTLMLLCEIYNIDDMLGAFGYTDNKSFKITRYEQQLIKQFRQHPEVKDAIEKLLDM